MKTNKTSIWVLLSLLLIVVILATMMKYPNREMFLNTVYWNNMTNASNNLTAGQCLSEGQYIKSLNGVWQLGMSKNGNVVTVKNDVFQNGIPIIGPRPHRLCMTNEKLVASDMDGTQRWQYAPAIIDKLQITNDQKVKTFKANEQKSEITASTFANP